ncbi:hypothetical protein D3C84_605630 [compost metagenome]
MNAVAKVRLLEMGLALGLTQAGSNAAGQAGINVDPETVGVFAKWTAILFGAGKAVGAKGGSSVANDFFAGTKYTDKVLGQIKTGDLHGFPESVTMFQGAGQVTKITGGDGVVRDMLKIPGEYRGKQGVFEFIKESDGSINHRLFKPSRAE